MIGTIVPVRRWWIPNGSGPRALPTTPATTLRNLPALPAQTVAGIQERLAHRI